MSEQTTRRSLLVGTATAALSGLAGCSSLPTSGSESESETTTEAAIDDSPFRASDTKTGYGIDLRGNPVIGPSDAPVDVYYWTDYQCPFCAKFEEETFPKLVANHVTEGEIRMVMLQLPEIGDASTPAARLDKCIWRQVGESNPGAYENWHAAVFDAQGQPNSGWAEIENLLEITRRVDGVDADAANACRKNDTEWAKSVIDEDVKAAKASGLTATPGFVLYNRESDKAGSIMGAQPYDRFASAIEKVKNA